MGRSGKGGKGARGRVGMTFWLTFMIDLYDGFGIQKFKNSIQKISQPKRHKSRHKSQKF